MLFSLALCTYNGAAWVEEQLASLQAQTRPPDELVIADDGSTDGTVEIIRQVMGSSPFPVTVLEGKPGNPTGVVPNFERAITACRGDIIALCDQDDIWLPEKLAVMERVWERQPGAGLVFSDGLVVDGAGRSTGTTLWEGHRFTSRRQRQIREGRAFETLLDHNVVTGTALAFRAEWKHLLLPLCGEGALLHDRWIALLLSAVAPVVAVPRALLHYRSHGAQHTLALDQAGRAAARQEHYRAQLHQLRALRDRLQGAARLRPSHATLLEERIRHLETRLSLPAGRMTRLGAVGSELLSGRYRRCSHGWRSAALDLLGR